MSDECIVFPWAPVGPGGGGEGSNQGVSWELAPGIHRSVHATLHRVFNPALKVTTHL